LNFIIHSKAKYIYSYRYWIPSHIGILSNEIANIVAKLALQNEEIGTKKKLNRL